MKRISGYGIGSVIALLCVGGGVASAQTATNPKTIAFQASADHTTTDVVTGGPMVTSYQLDVVAQNPVGAIGFSKGLGKPTPDATNKIGPINIPEFLTQLQANTVYRATVSALGPGGASASSPSNPFGNVGPPRAPGQPTVQ